jgi:GNAT superfamily N-acetyltransferase
MLGCTALLRTTPEWGWTNQQRDEATLLITGTYTHPAYRGGKLGRLMAWWTLDYAARHADVLWVRRVTFASRLMRYYRDGQGWDLVDTVVRRGRHAHTLRAKNSAPRLRHEEGTRSRRLMLRVRATGGVNRALSREKRRP